jgi:dipeptide/tripeptide permease
MGKIIGKLISWSLSALITIILVTLAFLGWYNYLFGAIFLVVGMVLAFIGMYMLAQCMRGRVAVSNPFGSPFTSRKQTGISIMFLLIAILFLTLGILVLTGLMDLTHESMDIELLNWRSFFSFSV